MKRATTNNQGDIKLAGAMGGMGMMGNMGRGIMAKNDMFGGFEEMMTGFDDSIIIKIYLFYKCILNWLVMVEEVINKEEEANFLVAVSLIVPHP